jgi:GNAT superfamily N-acetyltransferase
MPAPNYYGFLACPVEGVVYGVEKLADMVDELRVLHTEHYNETETLYLDTPIEADYDRYRASEAVGQFIVFTAREGSTMVGYLQYYVFRSMHSASIQQAREDAFFVTKSRRGTGIAPRLLSYAEDALKQLGCTHVGMSSKAPTGGPDIGPFLEKHGYKPVALYYVKKLES